jgi:hypothetical protein
VRILRDLTAITAEAVELMAASGLWMRDAVAIAMRRHGYDTEGGGSP